MRVLHVITARGGSKGVPGKNLQQIGGISLVGFKAISARRSRYCARVIVSSDSPEIQADAARYGVEAPFTRPAALATDQASTDDVVSHAIDWIAAHDDRGYDAVMILEPASPFATAADLDRAVEMLADRQADVVVSVCKAAVNAIFHGTMDDRGRVGGIVRNLRSLTSVRRQDMPDEYIQNGGLYLVRWDYFVRYRTRYHDPDTAYAIEMDRLHSIEIDDPLDLAYARFLVDTGAIDLAPWREGP